MEYGSLFVNILYILYIAYADCQQAITDSSNWVIHDNALADHDKHNAPNTTLDFHPKIINLTNYFRPAHHINFNDQEEETQILLDLTHIGELLASDITPKEVDADSPRGQYYQDINEAVFVNELQFVEEQQQKQQEVPDLQQQQQSVQYDYYEDGYVQDDNTVVKNSCPDPLDFEFIPGVPRSYIFNELSKEEILGLGDFISSGLTGDNIWWQGNDDKQVDRDNLPKPNDTNMLVSLQLYPPHKDEAIKYLDGETDVPPKRFAKAVVIRGPKRDVMEYKIGPLPLRDGNVIWEELTQPGSISYSKRPQSGIGTAWLQYVIGRTAFYLRDIFKDITGGPDKGRCYGMTYWAQDDDYDWQKSRDACGKEEEWKIDWQSYPLAPESSESTSEDRLTRVHWYFFPANKTYDYSHGDEGELHPIPLSFTVNETDPDFKAWTAYAFEYCGQYYENKEDLLTAFRNGGNLIYKCEAKEWGDDDYDWTWASTYKQDRWTHRTPRTPSEQLSGPRSYEPEKHRYLIIGNDTAEGRRFAWMGWEGHITMRPDTGLAFYDIRYNKERIMYELALQDQYVAYSGFTGAGQVVYFDSNFGMGMTTNSLKHGLDCPESAIYFTQTKLYSNGAVWADVDVICMFEVDMAETEWRHTHVEARELVGIRRTELVIRSISTIGNYDYIYDIRFKLDASIDVQIHMAGYMQALFFDPKHHTIRDMAFGTRVGKYTFANIHDHLSGWKVDLDVKGRKNTFEKQTVRYGTYEEAFAKWNLNEDKPPGWFNQQSLKYIELERVDIERGFVINSSEPAVWHFVNEASVNKFQQPNGYVIIPQDTHMQLMRPGHPFLEAASWTKYHLAVTKHKDYEYTSHASTYDTYVSQKPVRSLDKYMNGEYIVNEDLVGWVMVGVVHVPRTEDVPLISNLGIGFSIKPWNYFDELVSMSVFEKTDYSMECVPLLGNNFDYVWAMET